MNWLNDMLHNDPTRRDPRVDRIAQGRARPDGPERAHQLLEAHGRTDPPRRRAPAVLSRPPNTSTPFPPHLEAGDARRRRHGMAHPLDHPLERDGDGGARQPQARRTRRPHRQLRLVAPPCTTSASTISGARRSDDHPGDLLYIQGHSSPGIYARAFLEGRISEDQLDNFRMEVDGHGISSLSASVADAGFLADARPCRWAWARSARSTRRASGNTWKAAA